jgi:uncharacterized protein with PhoU and TrkA domain
MGKNIKENILKMKNLSELMVDLAYSALFLEEEVILNEVRDIHHQIKHLEEETLKMLFKIRETDEQRLVLMDLIDYIKDIANSALRIAELSESEELPPIVADILGSGDTRIIVEKVAPKSTLANKKLGDSKVGSYTGAKIIAIRRNNTVDCDVTRNTVIKENDELIATGSLEAGKLLKAVVEGK